MFWFKLNLIKGSIGGYTPIKTPFGYATTAGSWTSLNPTPGNKMGTICYQDGTTKLTAIYSPAFGRPTSSYQSEFFELLITA